MLCTCAKLDMCSWCVIEMVIDWRTSSISLSLLQPTAPEVLIVDEQGVPLYEKFYNLDSLLELKCIVSNIAMTSSVVQWHHDNVSLNYDATRGGIRWGSFGFWLRCLIIWLNFRLLSIRTQNPLSIYLPFIPLIYWVFHIPSVVSDYYHNHHHHSTPLPRLNESDPFYSSAVRIGNYILFRLRLCCPGLDWSTVSSVGTNLTEDAANSTLWVARVKPPDSGNYTCSVGPLFHFTTSVHVLNGKSCPFNWTPPVTYNWLSFFLLLRLLHIPLFVSRPFILVRCLTCEWMAVWLCCERTHLQRVWRNFTTGWDIGIRP